MTESNAQRTMCLQCYKAQEQCICDEISAVEHKTLVTIIQHPRERTHPFGTARITRHALSKVWVETFGPKGVWAEERSAEIEEGIRKRGKGGRTALLYPSPDATLLSELIEEDKPTQIVVLDGTWNHAKKLYAGLPFLQQLPKVMLEPERPSEYQIRQEPAETYVSTIEAIYYALRQLEPQNKKLEALLHPFRELIARQLKVRRELKATPRFLRRKSAGLGWMPEKLQQTNKNLVVCYLEYINDYSDSAIRSEIVAWVAEKPDTGDIFVRYVHPSHAEIADWQVERFEVPQSMLEPSEQRGDILQSWHNFLGKEAVIVTWHANASRLLEQIEPEQASHDYLMLKEVYANAKRQKPGHLEDALAREGLASESIDLPGRGVKRLSMAVSMLRYLRELYHEQKKTSD